MQFQYVQSNFRLFVFHLFYLDSHSQCIWRNNLPPYVNFTQVKFWCSKSWDEITNFGASGFESLSSSFLYIFKLPLKSLHIIGAVWTVCANICLVCLLDRETTNHLFYTCSRLSTRWQQFLQLTTSTAFDLCQGCSLVDMLLTSIQRHCCSPGTLLLLAEFLHSKWLDRNHLVFRRIQKFTP